MKRVVAMLANGFPSWAEVGAALPAAKNPERSFSSLLNGKIVLKRGDITEMDTDAVVNAANSTLLGGGGVDGAIHRAAGYELGMFCRQLGGCQVGDAKITPGFNLPAKFVIHTVGPQDGSVEKLKSCYNRSLQLAVENNLRSIAFPCISTGIYGYPPDPAARLVCLTLRRWLETDDNASKIDRIIICVFLASDEKLYEKWLPVYFPASVVDEVQPEHVFPTHEF